MLYHVLVFGCLASVAALLVAEYKSIQPLRRMAKTAASLCFVGGAVALGATETQYGSLILAGLVLCMAGDLLLLPKGERTFLAGMGAFALGHLAYAVAFLSVIDQNAGNTLTLLFAGLVVMALISGVALKLLWKHLDDFKWPVAAYTAIISVMVGTAFVASPAGHAAPYWLVAGGAFLFAISDLAVAKDQFVEPNFFNRLWGLPLYYVAQLMIASSV